MSSLWSRRRRVMGTGVAIVLGVAFLAATLVIGDSVRSAFSTAFGEANAGIDTFVRSDETFTGGEETVRAPLDATLVDTIAALDIVDAAVGEIDGYAQVLTPDGDPIGGGGPPTVGANWIEDSRLSGWDLADGRAPQTDDEVVLDRATFTDVDARIGGTVTILVPEPTDFTVVGVATFAGDDSLGPTTYAAFTTERARDLFLRGDQVSAISIAGTEGSSSEAVTAAVAEVIPDDAVAMTGAERSEEMEADIEGDFLGFMTMGLTVFAGIALLVAAFSIYNTFSIIVAQRARESALLRAIGASRRQVLVATLAESLIVGAVASVVGFGVGAALGTGLMALMDAAGFGFGGGTVVTVSAGLTSVVVGVAVTVLGGAAPAWRASSVSPMAALRDVATDDGGTSRFRVAAGATSAVVGVAMVAAAGGAVVVAGIGSLILLIGVLLLGPIVARPIAAVIGRPLRLRGVAGDLARRNAVRNPKRTSATASALLIGVGIVSMFTVFASSMSSSIEDEFDGAFAGDLMVGGTGFGATPVTPSMVDDIADVDGVTAVSGFGFGAATIDGRQESVDFVSDGAAHASVVDMGVAEGSFNDLDDMAIAVSSDYAHDRGYQIGDRVRVGFVDGGTLDAELVAIYDNDALAGNVIIDGSTWAMRNPQPGYFLAAVAVDDSAMLTTVRSAITDIVSRGGGLDVRDRDEFIEASAAEIDVILNVIYGLLGVAVLIALMGIANTMSLSIHERIRELGLLRAIGLSRAQVRSAVRWESVLVSTFGAIGGLGLGLFLSWGLVAAMAEAEGFGSYHLPVGSLVVIVALGAGAGLVAGIRPARRAARVDVLDALAAE